LELLLLLKYIVYGISINVRELERCDKMIMSKIQLKNSN